MRANEIIVTLKNGINFIYKLNYTSTIFHLHDNIIPELKKHNANWSDILKCECMNWEKGKAF